MYKLAREALLSLGAEIPQFQPILQHDLKVEADIVEENRFGQRSHTLAWFWRLGTLTDGESSWMDECECIELGCILL
jgi:hypothetical protein